MSAAKAQIDIETAVTMYYERISLSNSDIKKLFNVTSGKTVLRYKNEVISFFAGTDIIPTHRNHMIDTVRAYEAWGLDIADLEKRLVKLRKLKA